MNTFKYIGKPYLAMFLASLILFVSCSQYDDLDNEKNENLAKTEFTGEELFNAIFFGNGNLNLPIDHFNKIKKFRSTISEKELIQLDKFSNLVIDNISKKNSDFFKSFKSSMYSKNHYQIQEALEKSGSLIEESLLEIPETRESYLLSSEITKNIDINKFVDDNGNFDEDSFIQAVEIEFGDDIEQVICGPTFCGVWLVAALVQTVVVAVNYYVGVFVAKYTPWDKTAGESTKLSQLQNDILVNDIYENL